MNAGKLPRRYDLDWLRVIAFSLLVFYHAGMIFVSWGYHITNRELSLTLEKPMVFLNQWRMPLLFFISGVGVSFALGRRTGLAFAGERLKRLLIPLVFGMLVVVVPQVYYEQLAKQGIQGSLPEFYAHYLAEKLTWNHLWFIAYLLCFSLLSLPFFLFLRTTTGGRMQEKLSQWTGNPVGVFLWALPLMLIQVTLRPYWPDNRNLISDWYNFAFFLTVFLYGYLLGRQESFWKMVDRTRYVTLLLGMLAFGTIYFYFWSAAYQPSLVGDFLARCLRAFNIWCWLLVCLAFARRYLNFHRPFLGYATEAVYPFYILHQTVLIAIGYYVIQWQASIAIKFSVISAGTFIITLLLYELLIRRTNLTRWLFGLKPLVGTPRLTQQGNHTYSKN